MLERRWQTYCMQRSSKFRRVTVHGNNWGEVETGPTPKMPATAKSWEGRVVNSGEGGWAPKARESRRRRRREGRGVGKGCTSPFPLGTGLLSVLCPSPENFGFFYSKIVHSVAFLYTNPKVLFAIKCREKYVIAVSLAIDTEMKTSSFQMKTSSFHQSRKIVPIQSVSTNTRRFHSYSRHVL